MQFLFFFVSQPKGYYDLRTCHQLHLLPVRQGVRMTIGGGDHQQQQEFLTSPEQQPFPVPNASVGDLTKALIHFIASRFVVHNIVT